MSPNSTLVFGAASQYQAFTPTPLYVVLIQTLLQNIYFILFYFVFLSTEWLLIIVNRMPVKLGTEENGRGSANYHVSISFECAGRCDRARSRN